MYFAALLQLDVPNQRKTTALRGTRPSHGIPSLAYNYIRTPYGLAYTKILGRPPQRLFPMRIGDWMNPPRNADKVVLSQCQDSSTQVRTSRLDGMRITGSQPSSAHPPTDSHVLGLGPNRIHRIHTVGLGAQGHWISVQSACRHVCACVFGLKRQTGHHYTENRKMYASSRSSTRYSVP